MNFLAIVLALALEQWRSLPWRGAFRQLFRRYARSLERRFNAGVAQQGAVAGALALLPPVALAAGIYWGLDQIGSLFGVLWNVAILYLLVGFRHFSHAFTSIADALKAGDAIAARKRLTAWRGSEASGASAEEVPKLAIEQGLLDAYRHVFGTLFWFLMLPGPTGAVLYSLTTLLAEQWRGTDVTPMGAWSEIEGAEVRVLATFGAIPPDVIAVRKDFPDDARAKILEALRAACNEDASRTILREIFNGDELREGLASGYEALKSALDMATARGLFD